MCKVQWSNHTEEATWEKEDQLKVEFPEIFSNVGGMWHGGGSRARFILRGEGLKHPDFQKKMFQII
jgi:hypothetical protein